MRQEVEEQLKDLIVHAWDREITFGQIEAWEENFSGKTLSIAEEQDHATFALTRFMYFGKRSVRELLRALYRDHFESPHMQRIRRSAGTSVSVAAIERLFRDKLRATRFIGVGNPAESGAHLLYYFRQVNYLSKDLFVDFAGAFAPHVDAAGEVQYQQRDGKAESYVFFDDLVGSGVQSSQYLSTHLKAIRRSIPALDLRFMSLFATTQGLGRLNEPDMFDGKAICLYELDDTFKAFSATSRYFKGAPSWFSQANFENVARTYGRLLQPKRPLGYRDGQLLLGFSHNTPDNTLPIFWDEGSRAPWFAAFPRYDKM